MSADVPEMSPPRAAVSATRTPLARLTGISSELGLIATSPNSPGDSSPLVSPPDGRRSNAAIEIVSWAVSLGWRRESEVPFILLSSMSKPQRGNAP
jgi:hypothetical protein